jgi:hypothetical protein
LEKYVALSKPNTSTLEVIEEDTVDTSVDTSVDTLENTTELVRKNNVV